MPVPRISPACLALVSTFLLAGLPLVFLRTDNTYFFDESHYHLPAIIQIAKQWPSLDLARDCLSATGPGFHYLIATLAKLVGTNLSVLRLCNYVLSLGLLIYIARLFPAEQRAVGWMAATVLATSNSFLKSACWLTTDNLALLLSTGALFPLLLGCTPARFMLSCALACYAVFTRQITLWLCAPLVLFALFPRLFGDSSTRPSWFQRSALPASLAPLLVLAVLIHAWGGLTPPAWEARHTAQTLSFASAQYTFALMSIFGPFFLFAQTTNPGALIQPLRRPLVLCAVAAGLILALATPSTPTANPSLHGGYLWQIADRLPSVEGRSLLFALMVPAGAAITALLGLNLARICSTPIALAWLGSLTAWLFGNLANPIPYHRYYEPMLIIFLLLQLLLLARTHFGKLRIAPFPAIAGMGLLISLCTSHGLLQLLWVSP